MTRAQRPIPIVLSSEDDYDDVERRERREGKTKTEDDDDDDRCLAKRLTWKTAGPPFTI